MISVVEQIAIIKEAKERYIIYQKALQFCSMCWSLNITLKDKGHKSSIFEIEDFLPTFTYENVKDLALRNGFKLPIDQSIRITYWWDVHDSDSRLSAFDALIKQLESK